MRDLDGSVGQLVLRGASAAERHIGMECRESSDIVHLLGYGREGEDIAFWNIPLWY